MERVDQAAARNAKGDVDGWNVWFAARDPEVRLRRHSKPGDVAAPRYRGGQFHDQFVPDWREGTKVESLACSEVADRQTYVIDHWQFVPNAVQCLRCATVGGRRPEAAASTLRSRLGMGPKSGREPLMSGIIGPQKRSSIQKSVESSWRRRKATVRTPRKTGRTPPVQVMRSFGTTPETPGVTMRSVPAKCTRRPAPSRISPSLSPTAKSQREKPFATVSRPRTVSASARIPSLEYRAQTGSWINLRPASKPCADQDHADDVGHKRWRPACRSTSTRWTG